MADTLDPLILDLVEWLAHGSRPVAEVLDAWRTSCPRLPVWEEAVDRGLVAQEPGAQPALVAATAAGLALLRASGRPLPDPQSGPRLSQDAAAIL